MSFHLEDPFASTSSLLLDAASLQGDAQSHPQTESEPSQSETQPPPSPPATIPAYDSTAAAIANFRPSPREIINGIAPHVFDDQRSFRRRRKPSRPPKPYWYTQHNPTSSPLRVSAVISWDDHSIYLEPSETDNSNVIRRSEDFDCHSTCHSTQQQPPHLSLSKSKERKLDKTPRRGFRIDIPLLKTFVIKLKPANRTRRI